MNTKELLKKILAWLFLLFVLISVIFLLWYSIDVFNIDAKREIEIPSAFGFYYLYVALIFLSIVIVKLSFNKIWSPPVGIILMTLLVVPPLISFGFDCFLWSHGYTSCPTLSRKHVLNVFVKNEGQCKNYSVW